MVETGESFMDYDSDLEDLNWIEEVEREESKYSSFYNAVVENIRIIQILLDETCEECLSISHSSYSLDVPGILSSAEVIRFLRCQTQSGFKPISLLRFAVELEPEQIPSFLHNKLEQLPWLEEVSYTDDIVFRESVKALHETNTLFILYRRKTEGKRQRRQTRVVKLGSNENNILNKRKTRRKTVSFFV